MKSVKKRLLTYASIVRGRVCIVCTQAHRRPGQGLLTLVSRPALLYKKREGKARSAGHSEPMAKLCNAARASFVRNPKGRSGFYPARCCSRLTEACSAARLAPCAEKIRHRRGRETSVNRP